MYTPADFFSLKDDFHAKLFVDVSFVWNILDNLGEYFQSFDYAIRSSIPKGVVLENEKKIYIGPNCYLESGAFIRGPCILGEGTEVRHGAYIRGGVITGKGVLIGHDTEVKNSLLLDGSKAAHFAYLGDSILGNKVNLGAGVKCANLRLDKGLISIGQGLEKHHTGRKKLGLIAGDGVQIGCNSVTNPGTLMGINSVCYPCLNIGGYIKNNEVIRSKKK